MTELINQSVTELFVEQPLASLGSAKKAKRDAENAILNT